VKDRNSRARIYIDCQIFEFVLVLRGYHFNAQNIFQENSNLQKKRVREIVVVKEDDRILSQLIRSQFYTRRGR